MTRFSKWKIIHQISNTHTSIASKKSIAQIVANDCPSTYPLPAPNSATPKYVMDTTPLSILVIDDEPNNFDVIQAVLSSENYIFHYASSGQRALDRVDLFQPDLILLDVMMPDLDGIEVCHRIKALPRWQLVPIVMVTALTDKVQLANCLAAGADDFITKPVNRLELIARIASRLRMKQKYDSLQLAKNQLELAFAAQGNLPIQITHEMIIPVNNILDTTQLLSTTELTPTQQNYVRTVRDNGEFLLAVVNNILAIDRVDSIGSSQS
jgi:two-component system, sensor histidine kinase and response regulator